MSLRVAAAAASYARKHFQRPGLNGAVSKLRRITASPAAGVRYISGKVKVDEGQQPLTNQDFMIWAKAFEAKQTPSLWRAAGAGFLVILTMAGVRIAYKSRDLDTFIKNKLIALATDRDVHALLEYGGSVMLSKAVSQINPVPRLKMWGARVLSYLNPLPRLQKLSNLLLSNPFNIVEKVDGLTELTLWKMASEASSCSMICMMELKLSYTPLTQEELWWRLSIVGFGHRELAGSFDLLVQLGILKLDNKHDPPIIYFKEEDFVACRQGALKHKIYKTLKKQHDECNKIQRKVGRLIDKKGSAKETDNGVSDELQQVHL